MSRMMNKNTRGRGKTLMSTPKSAKSKHSLDDSYQDISNKRQKPNSKYPTIAQQAIKRKRAPSTPSESSVSSSDAEDEAAAYEATDDESDSDEDEPLEQAPSLNSLVGQTGRPFRQNEFDDAVSDAGSVASMFDPNYHFQNGDHDLFPAVSVEGKPISDLDDSGDDDAYKAVDDISDSDDSNVEAYEERNLLATLSDDEFGEIGFLNQIEGLSEYGFGDEDDETAQSLPSSAGSDTEPIHQRHVHFNVEPAAAFNSALSSSPIIARTLLPSALSDHLDHLGALGHHDSAPTQDSQTLVREDSYDSDATELDVAFQPIEDEASQTQEPTSIPQEFEEPKPTPKGSSKKSQRRGPPRGIFIDEGTKASGILDSTGKIMLITHPHLLGEAFAKRYGNSAPASPSVSFRELIDGSDAGDSQAAGDISAITSAEPDSLNALAAQLTVPTHQQMARSQDALDLATRFETGEFEFDGDDFDGDDLGEDVINMDDVIKFDDSDDSDDATSPLVMPSEKELRKSRAKIPSFASAKITAFRNNADPNFHAFSAPEYSQLELGSPIHRTPRTRKRKRTIDSPYSSSLYAGVTPVQRMRDPNPPSTPATPESSRRPKRKRTTTA